MKSHIPNKRQQEAFDKAVRAILNLQKVGLVVYGKQQNLVAYTTAADEYAQQYSPLDKMGYCGQIPCLNKECLTDTGADDYAGYISDEDRIKFNPDDF